MAKKAKKKEFEDLSLNDELEAIATAMQAVSAKFDIAFALAVEGNEGNGFSYGGNSTMLRGLVEELRDSVIRDINSENDYEY